LFLTESSPFELNLSFTNIKTVKSIIFDDPKSITHDLFHKIAFQVEWMLSDNFERFNKNLLLKSSNNTSTVSTTRLNSLKRLRTLISGSSLQKNGRKSKSFVFSSTRFLKDDENPI